jgi:putative addiction module component (TIGR02574 family)
MAALQEVFNHAMALSADERRELIDRLRWSMDDGDDAPSAWRAELDRRWAQVESGEAELTEPDEHLNGIFAED